MRRKAIGIRHKVEILVSYLLLPSALCRKPCGHLPLGITYSIKGRATARPCSNPF